MRTLAAVLVAVMVGFAYAGTVPRAASAVDVWDWNYNPETKHFYMQVGPFSSWVEAEAYAVSVGGHLVTINNQAEQDWLAITFTEREIMIGFNDIAVEGEWVWSSGEPVTFTYWLNGEPNNCVPCSDERGEDIAVMNYGSDVGQLDGWNDLKDAVFGIVEVTKVPRGATRDAVEICHIDLTNGGYDLITVNSTAVKGHLKHGDNDNTYSWIGPDRECTFPGATN